MTAPLPAVPERSIIFSAPMVRAILSGDKTQTRRALKVQPPEGASLTAGLYHPTIVRRGEDEPGPETFGAWTADGEWALKCPYGRPGNRLWVKEATFNVEDAGWIGPVYVESNEGRQALEWGYGEADDPDHIQPYAMKKRSPIFMKRAMSRITLEITGVRVERLQDISEADCIAEGASGGHGSIPGYTYSATPREHYEDIWSRINGADSWAASPWVWVIEFKRITP